MNEGVEYHKGRGSEIHKPMASEQKIVDHLSEISKNSRTTFYALIIACIYSYLTISTTSDVSLLTNSGATPLPIIQVKVPIVWFYYFAPILLTGLYLYFHFYLERFWYGIKRLPLYNREDRRGLDDYLYPWLISTTFIRGVHPKLGQDRPQLYLEYALSLLLAWWFIPIILVFYWARYLAAHEWKGTLLHSILLVLAIGFAFRFYFLAKNAVLAVPVDTTSNEYDPNEGKMGSGCSPGQISFASAVLILFGGTVFYLSLCAFHGMPVETSTRVPSDRSYSMYMPGTTLLRWTGIESYANIKEERVVSKPPNWQSLLGDADALRSYLETQDSLKLTDRNLRQIDARHAFLPASVLKDTSFDYAFLQHAVLTLSAISNVSFRGSDLTHVDFQYAEISGTIFENVIADVARFNHTRFTPSEKMGYTTFSGEYYDAWFENCVGDRLHFEDANLRQSNFRNAKIGYSIFQKVDLAGAKLGDAELVQNEFIEADFSDAQMQSADFSASRFEGCSFVSSVMKETIFEDAEFKGSRFDSSQKMPGPAISPEGQTRSKALFNNIDTFYGSGIQFKNVDISNTHFKKADLRFAHFENVTFFNTQFSNTDLSGSIFKGTDFSGVAFVDVDFSGADLTETTGLTQYHLENICGNRNTKLPIGIGKITPCIAEN